MTRYHRSFWMRLFRGSQFLRCRQCRATILLLPERAAGDDRELNDEA